MKKEKEKSYPRMVVCKRGTKELPWTVYIKDFPNQFMMYPLFHSRSYDDAVNFTDYKLA